MGMGCCLAALISDFLSAAKHTSMATTTFLANIAKGEGDGAEEMTLLTCLEGDKEDCVPANDNPAGASIDVLMRHNDGNVTDLTNKTTGAPPQQCCTPPAKEANQSAKKKRKYGNPA